MEKLTREELIEIGTLERDAGVRKLSMCFSWPEFTDERKGFHQEFVYDVAMFALLSGFTAHHVVKSAVFAKSIFPQLADMDLKFFLSSLGTVTSGDLSTLTEMQRHKFIQYFADLWLKHKRLIKAVVGGGITLSVNLQKLRVELPPIPCPLAQGCRAKTQSEEALAAALEKAEEEQVAQENVQVAPVPEAPPQPRAPQKKAKKHSKK